MQVKEIKSEGLLRELEVTVPTAEINKKTDERLLHYGKTIKQPGFRPGHVPLPILKQRYGRSVLGEVLEQAVNDSTRKVLTEKGLRPALQPKIEVKSFEEGKDLVYAMIVEILPEFELADLKSIKVEKPVVKAGDEAVNDALTRIASQHAESEPVERAAATGDVVVIDYHGRTKDDGKEHPGMHSHGQYLELGSGQFIAGFEDQLTGKKAGDKVEVSVTFPDPYHSAELAGREAIFDVDVTEVRARSEAKVDDAFAKKLGLADEAALRKAVADQIQAEYDQLSRMKVKRALLDALDDLHDFEVPAGMLDLEYGNIRQQIAIERPDQVTDGELKLEKDEEEELHAIAGRRVRLGMILAEVGRSNNIRVTDPELQRAVIAEARRYPGQEAQVFEYYRSNAQALEALRAPVFEDKVVDFILELAQTTESETTLEVLTAEEEDVSYVERQKQKAGGKKGKSASSSSKKKEEASAEEAKGEDASASKKKASGAKSKAKKST